MFLGFFSWLAAVLGIAGMVTSVAGLVVAGLVVTTVFAVMRASANGHTGMPDWSEFRNLREDVIAPGIKALVLALIFSLPAMAVAMGWVGSAAADAAATKPDAGLGNLDVNSLLNGGGTANLDELQSKLAGAMDGAKKPDAGAAAPPAPEPPMRWTALGAGLGLGAAALFPLALLILGISQSLLMALNPVVWAQILKETLASYLGLLFGLAMFGAAGALATWPLHSLSARLPIFPALAAQTIDIYVALCGAHMLGWFVWMNHERLGYTPEAPVEMNVARVAEIKAATLAEIERRGRTPRGPGPRGPAPK
ncbi:MAG TPA: hypothetical protein VMV18_00140 [bacterium]|nr:hypothetical protein [bacterium]